MWAKRGVRCCEGEAWCNARSKPTGSLVMMEKMKTIFAEIGIKVQNGEVRCQLSTVFHGRIEI
jgi:hypothetical protein